MKNDFEYKTESELQHDKETIIHNMKTVWNHYIKNHIAMLECTGIDDDGSIVYTDNYEKLREECARDIDMFEDLNDKLKDLNIALEGRDV